MMGNQITTCGYMKLTFAKCTTIVIAELTVIGSLRSSLEYWVWLWNDLGMEWLWFWNGYDCGMMLNRDDFRYSLRSCVIYRNPFMVIKING
jgi:hypothetical protein